MKLRVMLVEDHHLVREAFVGLLSRTPDIEVIANTGSGLEAVRLAAELSPDVIVMDIGLPDISGIEATRQIVERKRSAKVLCLSGQQDRHHVDAALRAGAMGYQIKECAANELVDAIRAVGSGRSYLCPSVTATVVNSFVGKKRPGAKDAGADLTRREREVLKLLADGRSVKQLAFELGISSQTAYTHRQHILQKLGIDDVASLIKYAIREGLTSI
jgi:DNA-binding NarL/FixJ family response regulator